MIRGEGKVRTRVAIQPLVAALPRLLRERVAPRPAQVLCQGLEHRKGPCDALVLVRRLEEGPEGRYEGVALWQDRVVRRGVKGRAFAPVDLSVWRCQPLSR